MSTTPSTARPKIDLKPLEVGVGAGAAVLTAVGTSFLGTTGTLTGAAVASVIGTVSTSVLRSSAQATNESLQRKARLRTRPGEPGTGSTAVDPATLAAASAEPETETSGTPANAAPVRSRWRRPAWWALAAGVVAAFAVALTAITGIEALAGKPLAAVVGNESGSGTTVGGGNVEQDPAPAPSQSPTSTPTADPSATDSGAATPTESPSPTPDGTTAPSPTAEPSATAEPSGTQPAPTTPAPTPLTDTTP